MRSLQTGSTARAGKETARSCPSTTRPSTCRSSLRRCQKLFLPGVREELPRSPLPLRSGRLRERGKTHPGQTHPCREVQFLPARRRRTNATSPRKFPTIYRLAHLSKNGLERTDAYLRNIRLVRHSSDRRTAVDANWKHPRNEGA